MSFRLYQKFIVAGLFLSGGLAKAVDCDDKQDTLKKLGSSSAEILKAANIDYLKSDTADFCYRNMLLRYLRVNNKNKIDPTNLTTAQLEKEVDKVKYEIAPWQMSMVSTPEAKEEAVHLSTASIPHKEIFSSPKEVFTISEEVLKMRYQRSSKFIEEQKRSEKIDQEVSKISLTAACAIDNPLSVLSCTKALNIIKEDMTPKGQADIINASVWRRVLGSNKYDEGIRLAALKISNRLENRENDKDGNVFDDLKEAFRQSGLPSDASERATWDVLTLIGNQGPNIGGYATKIETGSWKPATQKSLGLGFIATAMTLLDQRRLRDKNRFYSYPSNIQTTCDNSKPYHFWMAASLSRNLVTEHGIDPEVAAQATFLAQRGYQMNRDKSGDVVSTQGKNALSNGLFSPVHQIIRTDFAYGAAGAKFGSESVANQQSSKISVDGALMSLMEDAGTQFPSSSILGSSFDTFKNWNSIFSPTSAVDGLER